MDPNNPQGHPFLPGHPHLPPASSLPPQHTGMPTTPQSMMASPNSMMLPGVMNPVGYVHPMRSPHPGWAPQAFHQPPPQSPHGGIPPQTPPMTSMPSPRLPVSMPPQTPPYVSIPPVSNVTASVIPPQPLPPESKSHEAFRFQVELEFVQCLANPQYLNYLAQNDYFSDKAFVNYLKYLLYWRDPVYTIFLKYPQCLHMLLLLQEPEFRTEIAKTPCAKFIEDQQLLHWQHYSRLRTRLTKEQMDKIEARKAEAVGPQEAIATGGGDNMDK